MLKPLKQIKLNKIISTSITYTKNATPQWISDNILNYMSQYDFICYNLDEDSYNLIEKPFPHQVLAVRYLPLIGQHTTRIIYVYRDLISQVFYFVVLPSFNFRDQYQVEKIDVAVRALAWIESFYFVAEGQIFCFSVLFHDGAVALVFLSLGTKKYYIVQIQDPSLSPSPNYPPESYTTDTATQQPNPLKYLLRRSSLLQTKQSKQTIMIFNNQIHLVHFEEDKSQAKIIDIQYARLNSVRDMTCRSVCVALAKLYVVVGAGSVVNLFCVENNSIQFLQQISLGNTDQGQINCITGSLNSNKIVISFLNSAIILHYAINDMKDCLQFINKINFQVQDGISKISKILVSDTGRNVGVFCLGEPDGDKLRHQSERNRYEEVTNYFVFKIQLFTELGIPDCSLCIKQPKYRNRNKKVNRLIVPKIYQKIYALTGSQVHTLDSHKMSGVLFFDIHPYGFYMAVTYSFNIKVYSIESSSMTLLYSMTFQQLQQQLKKILYSPDGSNLVVFSSRKLKVLDAFSFQLKYEITEKNSVIVDAFFALKRNTLLILFQNGMIIQRSFYDFQRTKNYRVFCHNHRRFICMKMQQKNENIYILLQDGSIVIKHATNLTLSQVCLSYEDDEKISQFYIETKNNLIFIGTKSGLLRIHNVGTEKFSIRDFVQISVGESQISAIACSYLENCVYVGNVLGAITVLKYNPYSDDTFMAKGTKIIKNVAPKVIPSFSFNFQLISTTKFQGNSQLNVLQDKLQNLIQKIHLHSANFKRSLIQSYQQTQKYFHLDDNERIKALYKEFDVKTKKIKMDRYNLKQRHHKNKKELCQEYQNKVKILYDVQIKLEDQKQQILELWDRVRKQQIAKIQAQRVQYQRQFGLEVEGFDRFYKKEEFIKSFNDFQDDFKMPSEEIYRNINKSLTQELISLKQKCMQLNKNNSYLETAKRNILSRKVLQETLQHRINTELRLLDQVRKRQAGKIKNLTHELGDTEEMIHHIQSKVKNTPNSVSSGKAGNDLCSYKIWMKNKAQEQLSRLEEYLNSLEESFQKKSQQIVLIADQMKQAEDKKLFLEEKKAKLKQRFKELKYSLLTITNKNSNAQKILDVDSIELLKKKQNLCEFDEVKAKKIQVFEKLNEKAVFFENKNIKIHSRKIKNLNTNNAELIHEYEKLKYENKMLLDKQKLFEKEVSCLKDNLQEKDKGCKVICSERTSLHKDKQSPFLTYIRQRAAKTKRSMKSTRSTMLSVPVSAIRSTVSSRIHF